MKDWIEITEGGPRPANGITDSRKSIQVLGVIDDARFGGGRFADIVGYWPASDDWTVTHTCSTDAAATDFPCRVTHYQPIPDLP